MTVNELNILKSRLSQYRNYQQQIIDLKKDNDEKYRQLSGIHSPSLEGIHATGNPLNKEMKKHDIREEITRNDRSIDNLQAQLDDLNIYIEQLPKDERYIANQYYVKGKSFYTIGKKMFLDKTSVIRRLYKAMIRLEYRG